MGTLALTQAQFAVLIVGVVGGLFLVLLSLSLLQIRRSRRLTALGTEIDTTPPAAKAGPQPVSRREFFRKSMLLSLTIFGAQFGGASLAFLWPNLKGGFGSTISAGKIDDIKSFIQSTNQPFYLGAGRFYVVPYDGTGKDAAAGVDYYADGYLLQGLGLMVLYQRCAHLGCRVPFCQQSQWFECPCHGSKYNKAGEYELGPAPTGLQRFPITVAGGTLMVDTSTLNPGPPRGTDTIHQHPEGPFCVGTV